MVDDWGQLEQQLPRLKRWWVWRLQEFWTDPSCGDWSASRACFILANICAGVAASGLIFCGLKWNMSWTGMPAATIFTGIVASDAGVYWASTRKQFRCNGEERE